LIPQGKNVLFNVLACYAQLDTDIGYTQGMNLVAGIILMVTEFDEVAGFTVLERLMNGPTDWRRFYTQDLMKTTLQPINDRIYRWLRAESPLLEKHFQAHEFVLSHLLTGPFLTLFANIFDVGVAIHVLDRVLLYGGEEGVLMCVKNVL
jgi:hypothetical protein